MTCCLPGAGVRDVVERYGRIVKRTEKEAVVVVHVGVNDVGSVKSEESANEVQGTVEGGEREWEEVYCVRGAS